MSDIPAKNEWWDEVTRRESLHVPSDLLTIHYARLATTGSGKSVAELNDMLTAYNNFSGPVILVEPSGGDMCENYIKCHQALYGGTDDVEYIKIPGDDGSVPGMPFFDLRPLKEAAGLSHDVAVQAKIDDYFELLNYVLGKGTVEQAFVANEILTGLLKTMFDEKYGKDHFSIGEFLDVAQQYQKHGKQVTMGNDVIYHQEKAIPDTADDQQRKMLESHFDKNTQQFLDTTDAVLNRIRKLKERDFIWNMLSLDVPDENWDDEKCWYTNVTGNFAGPHDDIDGDATDDSVPLFDFIDIFGSNKVYLIDTGDIQGESSQMFSVMFLSHIWNSARSIHTPDRDDYVANILIEEAAGVARSKVVSDHILPEGRKFNLSLGLVMQYPEQVLGNDPSANQTAYNEILNNVNTKIIGNISADDKLAESLFHDDLNADELKNVISGLEKGTWLVELPGSGFGEDKQKPEVLTVEALPVPPGHDASGIEVPVTGDRVREESHAKYCIADDHQSVRQSGFDYYTSDQPDRDEQKENLGEGNETVEVTKDEQRFLEDVANALSDGHSLYTLGTSMNELEYSHTADGLIEKGLLDDHKMGNRQVYYSVTDKGADIEDVDPQPANGGEKGSESFEHRFGVRIVTTWLEQQGYDAEMYHTFDTGDDDEKLDVYAVDTKDSPDTHRKVVEVETCPDKKGHVKGDYEKLAAEYGDAIWVVETFDDGINLVQKLIDIGKLDDSIDTSVRTFEDLNDQLDADGISKVMGMTDLMDKV